MNSVYQSFDLNYLYNYFDNDKTAVIEFIEIVLDDFANIKNDLLNAIENNDIENYKDARHKTLTTLDLLKASKLQALLLAGKELLATGNSTPSDSVFQELETAFSDFLMDLEQVINQ